MEMTCLGHQSQEILSDHIHLRSLEVNLSEDSHDDKPLYQI
jgi:hypothetical protein